MHTRAYILQLIGSMIFPDKSDNLVHLMWLPLLEDFELCGSYSWGSACLAWLYRQLCRAADKKASQIAGCLVLLQTWAWDRFPHLSPLRRRSRQRQGMPLAYRWGASLDTTAVATHVLSVIREALDRQSFDQVVWHPYTDDVCARLPDYCLDGQESWRARVPLICFSIVEWHYPDRVIRQFGDEQIIPGQCDAETRLHRIDMRGKSSDNWMHIHADYIQLWHHRGSHVVPLHWEHDGEYATWYMRHSRPHLSHTGVMLSIVVSTITIYLY
ncbi:hypothetical protein MLD38_002473 [Melastoma candidum]|uniref:Uncharacterized protein n=1 Tax=Melastoma candidum TaxID=119954 RepID=A0ACB9RYX0_9MYRT|nr:hypothetical protein MLD38_002473 [Melastoma candidum]